MPSFVSSDRRARPWRVGGGALRFDLLRERVELPVHAAGEQLGKCVELPVHAAGEQLGERALNFRFTQLASNSGSALNFRFTQLASSSGSAMNFRLTRRGVRPAPELYVSRKFIAPHEEFENSLRGNAGAACTRPV
jgi:hypothetical protein